MQQSSAAATEVLRAHGATACTDVTGFGLLGHLAEMTRASAVRTHGVIYMRFLPCGNAVIARSY